MVGSRHTSIVKPVDGRKPQNVRALLHSAAFEHEAGANPTRTAPVRRSMRRSQLALLVTQAKSAFTEGAVNTAEDVATMVAIPTAAKQPQASTPTELPVVGEERRAPSSTYSAAHNHRRGGARRDRQQRRNRQERAEHPPILVSSVPARIPR